MLTSWLVGLEVVLLIGVVVPPNVFSELPPFCGAVVEGVED